MGFQSAFSLLLLTYLINSTPTLGEDNDSEKGTFEMFGQSHTWVPEPVIDVPEFQGFWTQEQQDKYLDERVRLEVLDHGPCTKSKVSHERLRLSDNDESPIMELPDDPGCYVIQGRADVFRRLDSDVQFYLELRNRPELEYPPEICKRLENDTDPCGGFGSCVYCQGCEHSKTYERTLKAANVKIVRNNKQLQCGDTVKPGRYRNIGIHFCLPTRRQYIETVGEDEAYRRFQELEKHLDRKDTKRTLFMKIHVFDFPIATYFKQSERLRLNRYGDRPLSISEHASLLFTKFMVRNTMSIACHAIHANVELREPSIAPPSKR